MLQRYQPVLVHVQTQDPLPSLSIDNSLLASSSFFSGFFFFILEILKCLKLDPA